MAETRRSVEVSAKNVEDAIQKGLAQLGVGRDQVEIRVITEGSRGILGIGAEDARVRLTLLAVAEPLPELKPVERVASPPEPAPPPRVAPAPDAAVARVPLDPAVEERAAQTVRDILGRMGLEAQVRVRHVPPADDVDDGPVYLVDVTGRELGVLIGRRGETLDALQYLTRLIVQHRTGQWVGLIVDVEGYRARREQTLRNLARQMAERVERDGRAISLEPMPPYERRIVHLALREHPAVMTLSVGEGDARKVTIRPKR